MLGFIETHDRAETEERVKDLEIVPLREISHRGVVLEEMDVDAIITRKPDVASSMSSRIPTSPARATRSATRTSKKSSAPAST